MKIKMEEYKQKIIYPDDKILFEEVIRSANAGAFRAAYIIIWICCVESLKRRFKEAEKRDHNAGKIVGEFEDKEKNQKSIDNFLLGKSLEYGFVSQTDFISLKHVYEMRCIYTHPYEKKPKPEELLNAVQVAVDTILSKPTKLRHGFIREQIRLLTEEKNYLDHTEPAIEQYADEIFAKTDISLNKWFIEKIWEKIEPFASDVTLQFFFYRCTCFCSRFLSNMFRENHEKQDMRDSLIKCPKSTTLTLSNSKVFSNLDPQEQDIVIGQLIDFCDTYLQLFKNIEILDKQKLLNERQVDRIYQKFKSTSLTNLANSGIHIAYFYQKLIDNLASHDWYKQNPAISVLKNIPAPQLVNLANKEQFLLGNNILQAADGNAVEAVNILTDLSNGRFGLPKEIIKGILFECFINDSNNYARPKNRHLETVIRIIEQLEAICKDDLLQSLIQRLDTVNTPPFHYHYRPEFENITIPLLRNHYQRLPTERNSYNQLAEKIEALCRNMQI